MLNWLWSPVKGRLIQVLLLFGLSPFILLQPLLAETVAPDGSQEVSISFEQVLTAAFKQNLGLQIEKQQLEAEAATESATFRKLLPSFSMSAGTTETLNDSSDPTNETTSYSSSLVMSQAIYQPTLMASWRKSELSLKKADFNLQRLAQKLVFDVKKAWYNVLQEEVLLAESRQSLARLKQHKQNAEAFYKSGKIWRNDLLQANVRVTKGEQDLFAAENRLVLAKSQVNLLLNRDIHSPFIPNGELEQIEFQGSLDNFVKRAMANRLDIKQSQLDIKIASKDKSLAKAKLKPTVNFRLSSSLTSPDFDYQTSNNQTTASINLNWNFWQFGQTSREVGAANAKLKAKQLALQQKKADIMLEVQKAYLTVMESQYSLKVSEQALQQSLENFRVSQIRYKEQLGSSNDVLDAQDLLTQTQTDRVAALSRYLIAIAELNLAVGEPVRF